ncbi:hypothetical protein LJC61_02795 [Ruminococcaceae bacterium OttesenSCG-928-A16]|nr:hypothetical protein [Ruminococcaceae bacterium OttesenSCG-928-A16]
MQKQYRAEFFTREYEYMAHRITTNPAPRLDYLTLENISFEMPKITGVENSFVQIVSHENKVSYQGIVKSVKDSAGVSTVHVTPLLSLLDVTVNYDRTLLQTGSVENFIKKVILDHYRDNTDTLQNILGVNCIVTSSTPTKLNIKSNVHAFWDICTRSLTEYGVVVDASFDVAKKQIVFTIGKIPSKITIETGLKNCLNKNIIVGETTGSLNKATYINKDNEAEAVTYYLHTNGKVDTENRDRIYPVEFKTEYVEGDDFQSDALARAYEDLTPKQYNNLIELDYAIGDKLISPENIKIGTVAQIIAGEEILESVLTGTEVTGNIITLIFGFVRLDFTKIFAIERRKSNASKA